MSSARGKLIHECNSWKAQAIEAKNELIAYKAWAAEIDKWHTELCAILGIEPVHPACQKPTTVPEVKP